MESRTREIVTIVSALAEQARVGALPDREGVLRNLRYIREQLEGVHARHSSAPERYEAIRADMQSASGLLFEALEHLEKGIVDGEAELLTLSVTRAREASELFDKVESRIEDLDGSSQSTG